MNNLRLGERMLQIISKTICNNNIQLMIIKT